MKYLEIAGEASSRGYSVTFLGVTVLAVIGCACVAWLVRPPTPDGPDPPEAGGSHPA